MAGRFAFRLEYGSSRTYHGFVGTIWFYSANKNLHAVSFYCKAHKTHEDLPNLA